MDWSGLIEQARHSGWLWIPVGFPLINRVRVLSALDCSGRRGASEGRAGPRSTPSSKLPSGREPLRQSLTAALTAAQIRHHSQHSRRSSDAPLKVTLNGHTIYSKVVFRLR